MRITTVRQNDALCAVVSGDEIVIRDAQSALDVLMRALYEAGTKIFVIGKELVAAEFFILSTGLAGEVLQKLVNYGGRIAIFGDYARYASKPLKDFMYESNKGRDVFFAATEPEAIALLARSAPTRAVRDS